MCVPAPWYALSASTSSPVAASARMTPQIRAAARSWTEPRSGSDTHSRAPSGAAMTWRFLPGEFPPQPQGDAMPELARMGLPQHGPDVVVTVAVQRLPDQLVQ
jgi:hypothetical protein